MDEREIYVLCNKRNRDEALQILDHFIPQRRELAEDYPFPRFTEAPDKVFYNTKEIMKQLETHPDEEYALYWENSAEEVPRQSILVYTEDGALVVGFVVPENVEEEWLKKIALFTEGKYGFSAFEEYPPSTIPEFIARVKRDPFLRLDEGKLFTGYTNSPEQRTENDL